MPGKTIVIFFCFEAIRLVDWTLEVGRIAAAASAGSQGQQWGGWARAAESL